MSQMLLKKLQEYIRHQKLFERGDRLLLAVSGGPDSVALFHLMQDLKLEIGVAHCNFKLRGEESDKDEGFVQELCMKHGIPFYAKDFDTEKYAKQHKLSIQVAARDLRYSWFEQIRKEGSYKYILTAHHLDDDIETSLQNIIRGTGLRGISGIPPINKQIRRPLLQINKREILDYLKSISAVYRADKSNNSRKYGRNKIRLDLIPLINTINPSFTSTFSKSLDQLKQNRLLFEKQLERIRHKLLQPVKNYYRIPIRLLQKQEAPHLILHELLRDFGFNQDQSSSVYSMIEGESGKSILSSSHTVLKDRKFLLLFENDQKTLPQIWVQGIDQKIVFGDQEIKIECISIESFQLKKSNNIAQLDFDKVSFPIQIRNWKKGDYFYPFKLFKKPPKDSAESANLKVGKKKVSDYLIDQKMSLKEKAEIPLVLSGDQVICLLGHRIDHRFRITEKTKKVLRISCST